MVSHYPNTWKIKKVPKTSCVYGKKQWTTIRKPSLINQAQTDTEREENHVKK